MKFSVEARATRVAMTMMLVAGFVYSGVATARHARDIFRAPAASGASYSIDAYLAPANLSSGAELRRAARCLGSDSGEIVLLADVSALSPHDLQQISYAAGYLLYPQRVRVTGTDPMTKNVIKLSSVRH